MDKHFLTCKSIQNFAVCILLLNIFMVFPQNYAFADENTCYVDQNDQVTLKVDNQPIKNVLALIERKTGYAVVAFFFFARDSQRERRSRLSSQP